MLRRKIKKKVSGLVVIIFFDNHPLPLLLSPCYLFCLFFICFVFFLKIKQPDALSVGTEVIFSLKLREYSSSAGSKTRHSQASRCGL